MSNSRWGLRLMGMLWGMNLSVAHYKTFTDGPSARFVVEPDPPPLGSIFQEISFDDIQITGGSLNYWESVTGDLGVWLPASYMEILKIQPLDQT